MTLVFVLVALTSFAVAAAPRLFDRVADDGLRFAVTQGTAVQRNLEFSSVDPVPAGPAGDPLQHVAALGEVRRDGLAPSIRELIGDVHFIADSPRFQLAHAPVLPTSLTFRVADGLDDQVDLVDGRWPARVADPSEPGSSQTIEIALSEGAAERIGLKVGDRLDALVDPADPMLRFVFPTPSAQAAVVLVGTFSVRDPNAAVWFGDPSVAQVGIGGTPDQPVAFATGLVAPAAYADILAFGLPERYRWRMLVDPARFEAGDLDTLVADLRRLQQRFGATVEQPGVTVLRTGLLSAVQRYVEQRATTTTVLSLAALGPLIVAAGALGLIGILVVRRRRPALALARGRGASGAQLMATQLWEGLLVTVPAALVGLGMAILVVPARPSALSSLGAMVVALGATLILLLATWPVARRARRDLERDDPPIARLSPRRLIFEALIVGLSLTAALLLRQRGLAAEGVAGGAPGGPGATAPVGFDPFLALSPVLIGVAVAVLTIRLYPIPVRALGWLLARRRGLVAVLGLRSLGRQPSSATLPLLILMVTLAVGTFSSVLLASLEDSQAAVAMQDVGADFRISAAGGPLDPGLDLGSVAGVEAVAAGLVVPDAGQSTTSRSTTTVLALAVEPGAYDDVLAGTPGVPALAPWFFGAPIGPDAGTDADPIPAVVSARPPGLAAGSRFHLVLRGRRMAFQVVSRIDGFPGIPRSTPFVITSYRSVAAGWQGNPLAPEVLFVRAPPDSADALRGALGEQGSATLTSRYDRYATLRATPLVGAVSGGFAVALALAAVYAGLAVMAVVLLHAQRHAREAAFLRTLGVSARQVLGLTVIEQGVPLAIALVLGIGLGIGLASLLQPGIDLAAFSSPDATVALAVDPVSIAAIAASIALVVVLAIALSSWLARRLDIGRTLRIGED
jgi:putative ABC transport system permease protein